MDSIVIRLAIAVVALGIAAIVNYRALSMADLQPSVFRVAAASFGIVGLLLVILLPFLPLLTLFFYFNERATGVEGMAVLFHAAMVGAAICTLGSGVLLVAKSIGDRKREA